MSQFDPAALPAPLFAYFSRQGDPDAAALFAPDAVVRDEGATHRGAAAIAAWLASVEARYQPRYATKGLTRDGDRAVVTFDVAGTFPGSPASLRQAFVIADGRIRSLQTL